MSNGKPNPWRNVIPYRKGLGIICRILRRHFWRDYPKTKIVLRCRLCGDMGFRCRECHRVVPFLAYNRCRDCAGAYIQTSSYRRERERLELEGHYD